MKLLTSFIFTGIVLFSFLSDNGKIAEVSDYANFLTQDAEKGTNVANAEFDYWNAKFISTPHQYPYILKMAAAQNALFEHTGHINHLKEATCLLEDAELLTYGTNAGIKRQLAKNFISEHRFTEAHKLLIEAERIGLNLVSTQKMLFDVNMEIGDYETAEQYLKSGFAKKNDFDYLIRRSKWEDHQGELSEAIYFMERAHAAAVSAKDQHLIQWTNTNLGDYYGHAGEIKKSYNKYFKALEHNPGDAYAKKGIAWIAFAHDRNTTEATRILKSIQQYYRSPDILLFLAEIAEYDENHTEQEKYMAEYLNEIESNPAYGNMYNKYNIAIYADDEATQHKALDLAEYEIDMRPTAQSYSLLAWSKYKSGQIKESQDLIMNHVIDHTFEPEPLFLAAQILHGTKSDYDLTEIITELKESTYELGPMAAKKIEQLSIK